MLKIINEIKNENSTNNKQELLRKYESDLLKKILFYTYNPYYTFNVKKFNKSDNHTSECKLKDIFPLLDTLRKREITGNKAIRLVEDMYKCLSEDDAEVFDKILQKDLKMGVNTKLINKVFKDLIPISPYLGAIPFDEKKFKKLLEKAPLISQEKMDGMFINLIRLDNQILTISRSGKDLHLADAFDIDDLDEGVVITGELMVEGFDRYSSNGVLNSLKTIMTKRDENKLTIKDEEKFFKNYNKTPNEIMKDIYIVAWDYITYEKWSKGKDDTIYMGRFNKLKETDKIKIVETRFVSTFEEAMEHFIEVKNKGGEGTIVKDKNVIFQNKKPNDIIKFKIIIELDMKITGYLYGNKGTKYEDKINRLVCETSDGIIKTTTGGVDEKTMDLFTEMKDDLIGKIASVECSGLSWVNGKVEALLHPRFVSLRDDKNEADDLETAIKIEESAKSLDIN